MPFIQDNLNVNILKTNAFHTRQSKCKHLKTYLKQTPFTQDNLNVNILKQTPFTQDNLNVNILKHT